nr:MAG TPA: hypothetical protein [Caudoviricetes sp.]
MCIYEKIAICYVFRAISLCACRWSKGVVVLLFLVAYVIHELFQQTIHPFTIDCIDLFTGMI